MKLYSGYNVKIMKLPRLLKKSDSSCNLAGTKAAGTRVNSLGSSVDDSLHTSDVGLPCSVVSSVWMGNLDAEGNFLAAEITLCHANAPPMIAAPEGGESWIADTNHLASLLPLLQSALNNTINYFDANVKRFFPKKKRNIILNDNNI